MGHGRLQAVAALVTVAALAGPALAGPAHRRGGASAMKKAGPRGPRGPRGRRGPAGATGPAGAQGALGGTGPAGTALTRTIVVSPTGGTPAEDGAALERALVTAAAAASSAAPFLVWLEPGVYDVGPGSLQLPAHVDLAGSGQGVTTIAGNGSLVLSAAAGTEVRELTVSDARASGGAVAIDTAGALHDVTAAAIAPSAATAVLAEAPAALIDVTANATSSEPASLATGFELRGGAHVEGGSATAVDAGGSGQAAALLAESSAALSDVTLTATGGSAAYPVDVTGPAATVRVSGSTLTGPGGFAVVAGATLDVGGSQVPGVATMVAGTARCPDDWLATGDMAASDCT